MCLLYMSFWDFSCLYWRVKVDGMSPALSMYMVKCAWWCGYALGAWKACKKAWNGILRDRKGHASGTKSRNMVRKALSWVIIESVNCPLQL
jgi:hypothetical protein